MTKGEEKTGRLASKTIMSFKTTIYIGLDGPEIIANQSRNIVSIRSSSSSSRIEVDLYKHSKTSSMISTK